MIPTIYPKCPECDSDMKKVPGITVKNTNETPFQSSVYLFQCPICKTIAAGEIQITSDKVIFALIE